MADSKSSSDKGLVPHKVFWLAGAILVGLYLAITLLSAWFAWERPLTGRPIRLFVVLMTAAFLLHLIALNAAIRMKAHPAVAKWIIFFAVGYRLILLPSHPIQEIDIYRYIWDGMVVANGGNPYQFSPQDVQQATNSTANEDLRRLAQLRDSAPATNIILSRIHFEHLTTIYPPVSQAVFATAAFLTPSQSSVRSRLIITKLLIVIFDLLAMLALLGMLRLFRKPDGWLVCYAWSPLVLKEFANSGHLDAIAIGFSSWALLWWLQALTNESSRRLMLSAATLGLGVGAKLYPIVFVPVIAVSVLKHSGWKFFCLSGGVLAVVSAATLWPMLPVQPTNAVEVIQQSNPATHTVDSENVIPEPLEGHQTDPPLPDDFDEVIAQSQNQSKSTAPPEISSEDSTIRRHVAIKKPTGAGLTTFMETWRMNDFIFLIIHENLVENSAAWFSILPENWKRAIVTPVAKQTGRSDQTTAFLITRTLTAIIHIVIALFLAHNAWNARISNLPGLAFLCVAWFWLLLPTQNPWYWIWAMPLLPFARLRSWLFVSGLVVIYYLRFWLQTDFGNVAVLGTHYYGARFFHFIVVWFEYVPFMYLLIREHRRKRRSVRGSSR